jgi:hypothetical protein
MYGDTAKRLFVDECALRRWNQRDAYVHRVVSFAHDLNPFGFDRNEGNCDIQRQIYKPVYDDDYDD